MITQTGTESELIYRQQAIDALNTSLDELVVGGEENAKTVENYLNRVIETIKCLPSAQPKRGKWIPAFNGKFKGGAYWFECSRCGRIVPEVRNGGWNFCPNCGADMRGEQDE